MWKEILLVGFASVALQTAEAHGGAESLSFHGFLPGHYIRSLQPRGDDQPNDVYQHLQPKPYLRSDEDVFYPPTLIGFGLEHGQDPESRVYKIYNEQEVEDFKMSQQSKFGKHAKGGHSKEGHSKGGHSKGGHSKEGSKISHSKPLPPPPAPVPNGLHPSYSHSPPPPPPPPHHQHQYRSQERIPAPSSPERRDSYPQPPPQYRSQERIPAPSSPERRDSYPQPPPQYGPRPVFPPVLPHRG